jgi:hypothetical protein
VTRPQLLPAACEAQTFLSGAPGVSVAARIGLDFLAGIEKEGSTVGIQYVEFVEELMY